MQSERCIPIKKKLVGYMSKWFPAFVFEGGHGPFYAFRRENPDGIFDHIILQREFYQGKLSLIITEVASCYNRSWKGIPWFTVGYGMDIRSEGKVVWHSCKNDPEELRGLFDCIRTDIDAYVTGFFAECHEKIRADKRRVTTNSYMQAQFTTLRKEEIQAIKEYLARVGKAYSACRKASRKNGEQAATAYFDILPLHPVVERWVREIQEQLGCPYLSEKMRIQIIKDATILFRDNYDYYDLN